MRIVVFNVAAEHSGALTILREFYYEVSKHYPEIQWDFIVSTPVLEGTIDHVKVHRYPWIKKSWFHRLYFDYFVVPKIIKKLDSDLVFSMQNFHMRGTSKKQVIYLHQPIPFSSLSFSFSSTPVLWIYKNILSHKIFNSIKKANKVIVQTRWMRDAAIRQTNVPVSRFEVIPPSFNNKGLQVFQDTKEARRTFFYPASFISYKNHAVILDVARLLIEEGIKDFQILFTGKEEDAKELGLQFKDLPVRFVGTLSHQSVLKQLSKSILIFPSLLETYGLPLVEARTIGSIVIASDLPFAHEILDDYPNAKFFSPTDARALTKLIKSYLQEEVKYQHLDSPNLSKVEPYKSTWKEVVNVLKNVYQ